MLRLVSSPEHYKGSFKFDSRFLNKPMVKEEIKKAWLTNHAFFGVTVDDKLKRCRKDLSSWKKRQSLNSRDKIVQIQQQLEKEQSALSFRTIRIDYLKGELITTYREEEKYWSQRCKEKWSSKGDRNTKYLYASVKATRQEVAFLSLITKMVCLNSRTQEKVRWLLNISKISSARQIQIILMNSSTGSDLGSLLR